MKNNLAYVVVLGLWGGLVKASRFIWECYWMPFERSVERSRQQWVQNVQESLTYTLDQHDIDEAFNRALVEVLSLVTEGEFLNIWNSTPEDGELVLCVCMDEVLDFSIKSAQYNDGEYHCFESFKNNEEVTLENVLFYKSVFK